MLIDTHAHICDATFDGDRGDVLERAGAAGVTGIIAVSENLADAGRNIDLAAKHPIISPAAGLHPTVLDVEQATRMQDFIRQHRSDLIAIGEVGLDYWVAKGEDERELQRRIFAGFIELSLELDLPLNVHSRSAGRHAISFLIERGARRVQMHAFDGKAGSALPAVEAGYFFSVPPSIIRSPQKQKLVRSLPLTSLLVETDSPVLGPAPGERNEPANVTVAVGEIARIKGIGANEVRETVADNTRRLYRRFVS
jgi:TatD DNase family protein